MADKTITGIVTWLKGWFYDKDEITTKENALQTQINNKASQSDLNTLSSTVSGKADSVHTHNSTDVTEASALSNIGTSANATQHTINTAINTAIGNLTGADITKVVTTLPTASASTQNALYLLSSNGQYDIYITIEDSGSYSWEKLDDDVLSDLSIDWSDIENKPTTFTPSGHTHYTSAVQEPYSLLNIGTSQGDSQNEVNEAIDTELGTINTSLSGKASKSEVIDWDTLTFVAKADDSTGAITFDYLD